MGVKSGWSGCFSGIVIVALLTIFENMSLNHDHICNNDNSTNVSATLKSLIFPGFENIKAALRILATLPVTTCECVRLCHKLKHYNRSTMKNE